MSTAFAVLVVGPVATLLVASLVYSLGFLATAIFGMGAGLAGIITQRGAKRRMRAPRGDVVGLPVRNVRTARRHAA